MREFEIRIEELPAMRVASFKGFSETPEMDAHNAAMKWAEEKGLLKDFHTFGFNNPPPWATEGPEYGYELWVVIGKDTEVEEEIEVMEKPAILCAVTSINRLEQIGDAWKYLHDWAKASNEYEHPNSSGLEEMTSPIGAPEEELSFNLWLPVKKLI
jgi:DNA gyrase inhibitor GyrI